MLTTFIASARDSLLPDTTSCRVLFRQGSSNIYPSYRGNQQALEALDSFFTAHAMDSCRVARIITSVSPEGSERFNDSLLARRAQAMKRMLSQYRIATNVPVEYRHPEGKGMDAIVPAYMRYALAEIVATPYNAFNATQEKRETMVTPVTKEEEAPIEVEESQSQASLQEDSVAPRSLSPRYMSVQTNMLYDAALLPSIAFEYYCGKNISVAAHWTYGWWSTDRRHRYWRAYGGDITGRYWFGSKAHRKPLTGHHAGVYAQMLIYDFEFGGKGHMAGKPGSSLWEKANYAFGLEYGYSLPIARRWNIDFSIGIGYLWGTYYDYKPIDNHYVWQATKQRHYFGPTKLEVSLVWLLGRGNVNKKGGEK